MNTIETSASNVSTTSSVSEFTLESASGTKRERASSVSSIKSFTTSYEPSEGIAVKLKTTEHTLKFAQERVIQLERKLDDVVPAKDKEDKAQLDETAKLRANALNFLLFAAL
ncbi:hypothetical protein DL98DRAFT_594079 [Cadophora sp. DSE1049]|nr:hypothetical protein DL98DRAFT_594079 [Cadophora sp. DSE1049]